jgi:Right handed beta helix region
MTSSVRIAAAAAAVAVVCGLPTPASALDSITLPVDCGRGQTIKSALSFTDFLRRPLVLVVRGTCNENVAITRDDVTLQGDPGVGGTVNGPGAGNAITVHAHRVLIDHLTVRGGNPGGIALIGASDVDIAGTDIQGAVAHGVTVSSNSSVNVTDSSIQYNGQSGVAMTSGNATITNTQIAFNSGNGVRVKGSSNLVVNGGAVSSNA